MIVPAETWETVRRALPIACVDLLVRDDAGRVLLVKRRNDPARGEWWFPGGRVLHGELRPAAAARKLREECRLELRELLEQGTHDLLLELDDGAVSHGVTTVYVARPLGDQVQLDDQSAAYAWQTPAEWLAGALHPFVRGVLQSSCKEA